MVQELPRGTARLPCGASLQPCCRGFFPAGVHQYKFIVDDQWRFAPDQPSRFLSQDNMLLQF